MNKNLLVFGLLFILLSVSFVSAYYCDTKDILHSLRKALYTYYINPSVSNFTANDLKSLLIFYLNIRAGEITIDCTSQWTKIDLAQKLIDRIPTCSDGTKYGKCSNNKPMYCYASRLVPRCRLCGCPEGQWCDVDYVYTEKGNKGQWGKCYPGTNITCTVDSDCGISNYIGNYFCKDGDVYKNYTKYICLSPGEINSTCITETTTVLVDDCQAGEECIGGQSNCQTITPPENLTCSDGTPYGNCSITKPKYCVNGTLIDNCGVCGCIGDYSLSNICQNDGTCMYDCLDSDGYSTNYLGKCIDSGGTRIDNCYGGTVCGGTPYRCLKAAVEYFCSGGSCHSNAVACYKTSCENGVCDVTETRKCSDGTLFGQCSSTKPKYCNLDGTLIDDCVLCGCYAGIKCQVDGTCEILTCSDGTAYGNCSITKPKYCVNGTLIDDCKVCRCDVGQSCQGNGSCIVISPTWWDSNWDYRRQLDITNNVEAILYNYSMKIDINTPDLISQGRMQNDCGDIRIIENNTEIQYGIRNCNSENTEIYFIANDLVIGNNDNIFIYYGNSNANNGFVGNWKDAFYIWYDDFDTDRGWYNCGPNPGGSYTVSDGYLTVYYPSVWKDGLFCPSDGSSFPMDNRAGIKTETKMMVLKDYGCQGQISLNGGYPIPSISVGHSRYAVAFSDSVSRRIYPNTWYTTESVYNRLNGLWYSKFNGELKTGNRVALDSDDFSTIIVADCNNNNPRVDYIYLRYFIEPEPTYSLGGEET